MTIKMILMQKLKQLLLGLHKLLKKIRVCWTLLLKSLLEKPLQQPLQQPLLRNLPLNLLAKLLRYPTSVKGYNPLEILQ